MRGLDFIRAAAIVTLVMALAVVSWTSVRPLSFERRPTARQGLQSDFFLCVCVFVRPPPGLGCVIAEIGII
jgi:hypothetical protein